MPAKRRTQLGRYARRTSSIRGTDAEIAQWNEWSKAMLAPREPGPQAMLQSPLPRCVWCNVRLEHPLDDSLCSDACRQGLRDAIANGEIG